MLLRLVDLNVPDLSVQTWLTVSEETRVHVAHLAGNLLWTVDGSEIPNNHLGCFINPVNI